MRIVPICRGAALAAGLLVLASAPDVWAQAASPAPAIPVVDLEVIVPGDARDTAGAASVLTADEILALLPLTLHDVLRFVPGVRAMDDDVLGRRAGIAVRAAPARRSRKTLLLEDGVPINASAYLDPSTHYTPPMERLERLDVLKGAGHLLHGPLNNHGIVNFRNKRPTTTPETTLDVGFGSRGIFSRHAMHRRTDGRVGLVLAYTGQHADGAFDVEDHRYDDLFASVEVHAGEAHEIGGSLTWFHERSHYDESNLTPEEFAVAPRRKFGRYGEAFNALDVWYRKADVVHRVRVGERLSIGSRVFVTDLDRPRFMADPGDAPLDLLPVLVPEVPFVPGVSGVMIGRDRRYRTAGADVRFGVADLRAAGGRVDVQWGMRAEAHRLRDLRRLGGAGQVLTASARGEVVRHEAYAASAVSGFVKSDWQLGRFQIAPGIRIEHYTQAKHPRPSRDAGPEGLPRLQDAHTLLLPAVDVLLRPRPDTEVFGNAGRGYTPAFARTAVGFPLQPETGLNTQAGVRTTAVRGLSLEAAAFYNRITDTVVQLPFTLDSQGIFLNSEDSRSHGLDAAFRLDSAAFTRAPLNLFAAGVYVWTVARFRGGPIAGHYVPDVPVHSGALTVGAAHAAGWQASVTLDSVGRFFSDPANTIPFTLADEDGVVLGPGDYFDVREPVVLGRVPGRTLLSARLSARWPGTPLTVWIRGRNLADRLYVADIANGLRPGAARTVAAGVRVMF